jgi:hypothetical protein
MSVISAASSAASSTALTATDSKPLLLQILMLEKELAKIKIAMGVPGVVVPKKQRTPKDPSAPKAEPNEWIKFTQRVSEALKTVEGKRPATVGKQFASHLKDIKAYAEWTQEEMLEAFSSWTAPEQSKMEAAGKTKKARAASAAASVDGSVSSPEGEVAEKKPRKERTEEEKAATKAKRAATAAAKKAAGGSAAPAPAAPAPPAAPARVLTAHPTAFKPKAVKAATTYTLEQLQDFSEFTHANETYGRNARGDVVDGDENFVGHWTGKAIESCAAPADWDKVMA